MAVISNDLIIVPSFLQKRFQCWATKKMEDLKQSRTFCINTEVAHDHGEHPLTLSPPTPTSLWIGFSGYCCHESPPSLYTLMHNVGHFNSRFPKYKTELSQMRLHPCEYTYMCADRRLKELKSMSHEPMQFSARGKRWYFKASSSGTASAGLLRGVPSAHSPNCEPDDDLSRVSFQFVLKSLFSIEFHPTRAAERAHCQTPNAALTYPEQPSPICLYQLNLTATPLVIAMLCQNKSTGIRRESISTLIKDLPAGFSKCKVYLIIAFQWVFRKSSSSMYDSFSSAQTICSLCMASI